MVAMRSSPYDSIYSGEKYSFTPGSPGLPQRVSDAEWTRGHPLTPGEGVGLQPTDAFYHSDATFAGKTFPRTGEFAFGSEVSEHRKWIVVYSYDGHQVPKDEQRPGSIAFPGVGPDPRHGKLHIDFYEIESAAKRLSLFGEFHTFPSELIADAYLLSDQYYVIAIGEKRSSYRSFLFCVLPSENPKP